MPNKEIQKFSTKKQADNPENDSVTSMLIGGDEIDVEFNLQTGDIKKRVRWADEERNIFNLF